MALSLSPRRGAPFERAAVRRILVVRTDGLGDMVLTIPLLDALAAGFPDGAIHVLAPAPAAAAAEGHPAVARVVPLADASVPGARAALAAAGEGGFDLAIDPAIAYELAPARLAAALGRWSAGFSGGGRERLLDVTPGPPPAEGSEPLRVLAIAGALGCPAVPPVPRIRLSDAERARALSALEAAGAGRGEILVGIHPGGRYETQRYPPGMLAGAARLVSARPGVRIVLLGSAGDAPLLAPIRAALGARAIDPGPRPPREAIALLAPLAALLCNNSGPLHAASALGVPTVSTLGPSDPDRFGPRGPRDRVIARDLWCRPCGRGRCPLRTHECLRSIPAAELAAAVVASLDAAGREAGR